MSRATTCDRCGGVSDTKEMLGCVRLSFGVTIRVDDDGTVHEAGSYSDIDLCRKCTAQFKIFIESAIIGDWPRPKPKKAKVS